MAADEKILTVEEVAEMLKVTDATVRRAVNEGRLKAFKQFGKWYIFHQDIVAFIKSGQCSGG